MGRVTQPVSAAIILYGHSLLLDSIELTLRKNGRSPVLRLSDLHSPLLLDNIPAGMIIYDQEQVEETAVFQLLTTYPGWQAAGLIATQEGFLIISSEQRNGRSLADVIEMIQR